MRASLPPSLITLFRPHEADLTSEFGMMGRVLDLAALAAALEPVWIRRVRDSGVRGGSFYLSTSAGGAEVRVSDAEVRLGPSGSGEPVDALGEGGLAHLLFRGFDGAAGERFGARPDASLLRTLFPEQDFVVWRADAF